MSYFKIEGEHFAGAVKVLSPTKVFGDNRGYFATVYREDDFQEMGLPKFVQDNHSCSKKNVIRGLHYQLNPPMGKLMRVTCGEAFLVAVDLRKGSPTFLQWMGVHANEDNKLQVWAPAEFARGFCALSDRTEVQYKCSGLYDQRGDLALRWNDPAIGIKWPVDFPIVSEKDSHTPTVEEFLSETIHRNIQL